jgi:coenzyme F420-reducing hydrogenase gamma subunit
MGEKMTIEELMENIDDINWSKNDMSRKNIYGHVDDTDNSEYINSIKKLIEVDLPFPSPINRHQRRANIAQERK